MKFYSIFEKILHQRINFGSAICSQIFVFRIFDAYRFFPAKYMAFQTNQSTCFQAIPMLNLKHFFLIQCTCLLQEHKNWSIRLKAMRFQQGRTYGHKSPLECHEAKALWTDQPTDQQTRTLIQSCFVATKNENFFSITAGCLY